MSKRRAIALALTDMLKNTLIGSNGYTTNIYGNVHSKLKYWNEVNDFPSIYMSAGTETREYHPSNQRWGYIPIALKLYVNGENSQDDLESLLDDVEKAIEASRNLIIDSANGLTITEMLISSITTDEGHLAPYGVGEIVVQVMYPVL